MLFVDEHRETYGVEPICEVLPIAPSTYYEQKARQADPSRLPERARRDAVLCEEIKRVWGENRRLYGARKVWHQLRREDIEVADLPRVLGPLLDRSDLHPENRSRDNVKIDIDSRLRGGRFGCERRGSPRPRSSTL